MSARSGLFGIESLGRKPDLDVGRRRAQRPRGFGFARRHAGNAAVRGADTRRAAKRELEPPRAA